MVSYQFSEIIAFPRTLILRLPFFSRLFLGLLFGNEERFFFFCKTRPIFILASCG